MRRNAALLLIVPLWLGGCQAPSTGETDSAADGAFLTGQEIQRTVSGKTLYKPGRDYDETVPDQEGPLEYYTRYHSDGTMTGQVFLRGGAVASEGRWHIDGNRLCQTWTSDRLVLPAHGFGENAEDCYKLRKDGKRVRMVNVVGDDGDDTAFIREFDPDTLPDE
jgi:hypothetical protein